MAENVLEELIQNFEVMQITNGTITASQKNCPQLAYLGYFYRISNKTEKNVASKPKFFANQNVIHSVLK